MSSLLIFIFVLIISVFSTSQNLSALQYSSYRKFLIEQKRLFKDLFTDYDPDISALYTLRNSSFVEEGFVAPPKLILTLQCVMMKLIDVEDKEEKFTFLADYIVQWQDIRLEWDPRNYSGITHIYVAQKNIWIPEMSFGNVQDIIDYQSEQQKIAWITYDGSVSLNLIVVPSVVCPMDVFKFPMDTQICALDILFHSYYLDEYEMVNKPVNIPTTPSQLGNGEWEMEWVNATKMDMHGLVSDVMQVEVKIRRNPGFYIALVIIPAYFINSLSIVALFHRMHALPEKFGIGLTNIMAMTFILGILADSLPKTKRIPRLAIYVIDQDRLYTDLFSTYNAKLSPIFTLDRGNGSDIVSKYTVNIISGLLELIDISDPEESATFVFDYTSNWLDPRLSWNPNDYGGILHLYLPINEVWVPEIAIVDCTKIKTFLPDNMQNVWIQSSGLVSFHQIELVSVICEMDVFRFPMDQHICGISVIFYTYLSTEYQINATFGTLVRPVEETGNGEWQMKKVQLGYETVNGNSTQITKFQAVLKRNAGFYIVLVIIPSYFINALSIIALFCNLENRQEKLQIGLTNIMSMSFIMVILSDDLPKTRQIPLLAVCIMISLSIMLAAMATVLLLPKIRKSLGLVEKFRKFKIEYVIMLIFELLNFINLIILFV